MNGRPRLINLVLVFAMVFGAAGLITSSVQAAPGAVRISQVYGGGGNFGATYTHDFVELFNASESAVDITGWSVQYASSTGSSWNVTVLSGSIQAGAYYLVQQNAGSGGTTALPTPDAVGNASMAATNGKVALVNTSTTLTGTCPTGVVDFVGFGGTANCYEGSGPTATLSNTTAAIRNSDGCTDTDDNAADFSVGAPTPRNSASPTNGCAPIEPSEPKINEFSASTTGTDVEYIEIFGDPSTDYSSFTLLEIEGDAGTTVGFIDEVIALGTTDANGLYLVNLAANDLENGTISLLLVKDFTGAMSADIDTDDDGVIDVSPWSALVDSVAITDGGSSDITYGIPVLGPNYDGISTFAPGGASRIPDGFDTESTSDWVRNDFDLGGIPGFTGTLIEGEAYNTPGDPNMVFTTSAAAEPKINEFSSSTTGTDVEFIEIFGDPTTDYSAYTLLEIEGDSNSSIGVIDEVIALGTTDANGLYLDNLAANTLENGTISLLLVKDFTGAMSADIDSNNDGVIDFSPWSALVDSVAINDGGSGDITYGTPVLSYNYDGIPFTPGGASRIPDGHDTESASDWVRNDFDLGGIPGYTGSLIEGEAYNTPGEPNMVYVYVPPAEECGDAYIPIYAIQGAGTSTPLYGSEVSTEGIVVGDFQTAGYVSGTKNGFYIQDVTGDGDPATSDGVFVYYYDEDISVGDHVRVQGTVTEYYDVTQIGSVGQVWVCQTGAPLPTATEFVLPVGSELDFERHEGMLVTVPQPLVISEYYNFARYGEIKLTTERYMTYTAVNEPDVDGFAAANYDYFLNSITLDDGLSRQNPDPAIHPNGSIFDMTNLFRGGDTVTNVTGIVDYSFDLYRIQPTQGADYTPVNHRPGTIDLEEGDLKIASFNVLNYFVTLDTGSDICGPSGNMECRGADTAEELARQRAKILAAMSTINADIFGLMEIENDSPFGTGDPVADLVAGLNDLVGAGTYDYIYTGAIGTDAIKVALLYKPTSVTPVGAYQTLTSAVDPRFDDMKNRPTLAQVFVDHNTLETFTVAVNHLKSKGSDCDDLGDPDLFDGAGNCNLTRLSAAEAMVDWLANDAYFSQTDKVLIIGDLNSYDKEDPIDAIKLGSDDIKGTGDDYFDMIYQILGEEAYTYVFDGQMGYLDYAMVSAGLVGNVVDIATWHINADEPSLIDYDMSFKLDAQDALYADDAYRSSDHDPVIISLTFDTFQVAIDIKPGTCLNPLNVKDQGVIPVAILGSADFDVTMIDPATILLAGVSPVRWSYEDVSSPFDPLNCNQDASETLVEMADGYMDLVLQFDTQEVLSMLGEVADGDVIPLQLTGNLLPEFWNISFIGEDTITIMKKGKQ